MENKQQVQVKVFDHPETWIFIDADRNQEEAKFLWLKKHNHLKKPLPSGQINRERETVRNGKITQRLNYRYGT